MQPWDQHLIDAARLCGNVDLTAALAEHVGGSGDEPTLDPVLLCSLLSGHPPPPESPESAASAANSPSIPCTRWRIRGARFSGLLDLSDTSTAAGRLPALEFEHCSFPEGFRADHVSFRRLSFTACSFGTSAGVSGVGSGLEWSLSLHNTRVDGDLVLHQLESRHSNKLLCLFAFGLQVEGSLRASECKFKAPPESRRHARDLPHYALDFYGARVRDDLRLSPQVEVNGGMRLKAAHVGGDLALFDLQIQDGFDDDDGEAAAKKRKEDFLAAKLQTRDAISGTTCTVSGNVRLERLPGLEPFRARGGVRFYGVQVGGTIIMTGAVFEEGEAGYALYLALAFIQGDLRTFSGGTAGESHLRCNGYALLDGLRVSGCVDLRGSVTYLRATGLKVGGDVILNLTVASSLDLSGADIKGQLDLTELSFEDTGNAAVSSAFNSEITRAKHKRRRSSLFFLDENKPSARRFVLRDADIGHTLSIGRAAAASDLVLSQRWRLGLQCFPGFDLYEIGLPRGVVAFLVGLQTRPILLAGVAPPIHELSRSGALDLGGDGDPDTVDKIRDYVRFFCAYVWGDLGPFVVTESSTQFPNGDFRQRAEGFEALVKEMTVEGGFNKESPSEEKQWEDLIKVLDLANSPLPEEEKVSLEKHLREYAVRAVTCVRYGSFLFHATLVVLTKAFTTNGSVLYHAGWINMINDNPVAEFGPEKLPSYNRPFVESRMNFDYAPERTREKLDSVELGLRVPVWPALVGHVANLRGAAIDLTNTTCGVLDDDDGRAWGSDIPELELENFTYKSVRAPSANRLKVTLPGRLLLLGLRLSGRNRLPGWVKKRDADLWLTRPLRLAPESRREWLGHMAEDEFVPQPYAQLAGVLQRSGDPYSAREIETVRLDKEFAFRCRYYAQRVLTWPILALYWLLWSVFRGCFQYGLSPLRATVTWLLCLCLGWWGVVKLDPNYLVQNTVTSATELSRAAGDNLAPMFPYATGNGSTDDLPCGQSINKFLYAVDVFIPLLDLKQESRCDIRSYHKADVNPQRAWDLPVSRLHKVRRYLWAVFHAPVLWAQMAKSLYAILGWVVISLTILTYSGILRRSGDNG